MKDIEHLVTELADDTAPVKAAPHPYWLTSKWIAVATVYLVASLAIAGLRPDLEQAFRQPWFTAEIITLVLIVVATSLSAALLAFPDLHQKRGLALAPLWTFLLFVLVLSFAWHADSPPSPLPEHSYQCTACIILLALLPAAWTLYAMRHVASTHFGWAGTITMLSAFSIGALWLRLHEVNDSILHVIEWHYLPMLAFGILGLWLGRSLLRW